MPVSVLILLNVVCVCRFRTTKAPLLLCFSTSVSLLFEEQKEIWIFQNKQESRRSGKEKYRVPIQLDPILILLAACVNGMRDWQP